MNINEDRIKTIYLCHRLRPPRRSSYTEWTEYPVFSLVKYLDIILDKRITWRLHTEITESKVLRTFIRIYSILKSEHLSTDIKLTLHKALISSVMTCLPSLGIRGRHLPLKIAAPIKEGSLHH
jgi:hypothetical protein